MSTIHLGSRTTAEQALRGASLSGKRAIVTGAVAANRAHLLPSFRDRRSPSAPPPLASYPPPRRIGQAGFHHLTWLTT
jgi:hypothetical protein